LTGVHITDWIAEKIAVVTPTPSASDATAKAVNAGADRRRRQATVASRESWLNSEGTRRERTAKPGALADEGLR
jgi:hypothetical protein